ncbi:hypothetical protein ACU686_00975 [Yinghuangia aomiensis]
MHGLIRDLRGAGADGAAFGPGSGARRSSAVRGDRGHRARRRWWTRRAGSAAAYGCPVLYAKGGEREQGRAFHVVRRLFRPLLVAADDRERHELLGAWWDMVSPRWVWRRWSRRCPPSRSRRGCGTRSIG